MFLLIVYFSLNSNGLSEKLSLKKTFNIYQWQQWNQKFKLNLIKKT